jgi:choline dehydrogenase
VIEAGRDEAADNINVTVPLFNAKASEDERLLWAFYVRQIERQRAQTQG